MSAHPEQRSEVEYQRVVRYIGGKVSRSGPLPEDEAREQVERHRQEGRAAWVETRTVSDWRRL